MEKSPLIPVFQYQFTEAQAADFTKLREKIVDECKTQFPEPEKVQKYSKGTLVARMFVARDYNIEKGYELWKKWKEWRIKDAPDNISEDIIAGELKAGKAFWHKHDKRGTTCVVVKLARHIPGTNPIEETLKYAIYMMEKGFTHAEENGTGKICVLWDREGVGYKNFDTGMFGLITKISSLMQECYAEVLDKIYILYPNWLYKSIMAMVKPFLHQKTLDKIVTINEAKELKKFFDDDCLLPEHGGTSAFKYEYPRSLCDFGSWKKPVTVSEVKEIADVKEVTEFKEIGSPEKPGNGAETTPKCEVLEAKQQ